MRIENSKLHSLIFQYKVEYRMAPNETAVGLDEFSSPNGWRVASISSIDDDDKSRIVIVLTMTSLTM